MVKIKKKLYKGLTHEDGYTCGFAFESSFTLEYDIRELLLWLTAKGFFDFHVENLEHLLFKDLVQAEEFQKIYPLIV